LSLLATTRAPSANFYLLPTRAWELGVGSILATLRLPSLTQRWIAELLAAAGLALILVPVHMFDAAVAFPGANALYPCLGAALVIYAGRPVRSMVTALLSTRPLVLIGLISYSLYLVHWPIIVFVRYSTVEPLNEFGIIEVLSGSFVLAFLLWRFVETPFRRPRPALTTRVLLVGGGVGILVAGLVGFIGVQAEGFPGRFPAFARAASQDDEWKPGRCFMGTEPDYRDWSAAECTRIATGPHRVLLWGDSFAAQYIPGIIANADIVKATVLQYTAAGCVPVLSLRSLTRGRCVEFTDHALNIVRDEKIDTVILTARWTEIPLQNLGKIRSTLDALRKTGVHVIMLGQSPEFAEDVHVIAYFKGSSSPAAVNRWTVAFAPDFNARLAKIAGTTPFIDPMPALCNGALCTYEDRGVFLYSDFGHLSVEGSRRAVRNLFGAGGGLGW
jgi:hypothetical protein